MLKMIQRRSTNMKAPSRRTTESACVGEDNFRISPEEDAMSITFQVFGDNGLKGVTNAAMERGFSMPLFVSFLRPLRTQNPKHPDKGNAERILSFVSKGTDISYT